MDLNLRHKNALVCGSSQGIGKAVAIELALLGANVTLFARNAAQLQAVLATLDTTQGQQHDYLVADFALPEMVQTTVAQYIATHNKPIHILVNNTGGPATGSITSADSHAFISAYQQHVIVNQLLAQTLLAGMQAAQFGRIINIISTSVKEPIANLGVSNTTRAAVANWAKTWAGEVGQWGITVNNVLPGFTATARLDNIIAHYANKQQCSQAEAANGMLQYVPAKRFADPAEIAAAVAFLASPAAAYINGINLPVDGGRTKSL
jgi:3-oxoacyl-[acyl-carrier protein] reductase